MKKKKEEFTVWGDKILPILVSVLIVLLIIGVGVWCFKTEINHKEICLKSLHLLKGNVYYEDVSNSHFYNCCYYTEDITYTSDAGFTRKICKGFIK